MQRQVLMSILCLFLLSGCFFKKSPEAGGPPISDSKIVARFSVWDARGFTEKGPVFADDVLVFVGMTVPSQRGSNGRSWRHNLLPLNSRGPSCSLIKGKATSRASIKMLDLGMVGFQFPGDSNWSSLSKQENGVYYGRLGVGQVFPQGIYKVKTSGSKETKPLDQEIEMPDVLEDPALNANRLDNGIFTWDPTENAQFTWKKTAGDYNQVQMQILGEKNGAQMGIACVGREKDFASGTFEIPSSQLTAFTSEVKNISVSILRAIAVGTAPEDSVRLDIEGVRVWETAVTLK